MSVPADEAIDMAISALDREWRNVDEERGRTPYPDDQPILEVQQRIQAAIDTLRDLKQEVRAW